MVVLQPQIKILNYENQNTSFCVVNTYGPSNMGGPIKELTYL